MPDQSPQPEPIAQIPAMGTPSERDDLGENRHKEYAAVEDGVVAAQEYVVETSPGIRQTHPYVPSASLSHTSGLTGPRYYHPEPGVSPMDYLEIAEGVGSMPGTDPYATRDRLDAEKRQREIVIRREMGKVIQRRRDYAAKHPVKAVLRGWGKYRPNAPGGDTFLQREAERLVKAAREAEAQQDRKAS